MLFKIMFPVSFYYLKCGFRKFKIAYAACIMYLLDCFG